MVLAGLDSGRGGAEVWTTRGVDREEHRQLTVEVVVGDAGGLAATHPITVIIDDINDNPMKPATKTVHLWKTQVYNDINILLILLYCIFVFGIH